MIGILKKKSVFGRVIACILTACVLIFTLAFCYIFYEKEVKEDLFYTSGYYDMKITNHIWYHYSDEDGKGYVFNCDEGRKTLKGVSWVAKPGNGEHLAVYSTGEKRGYFDIYTGKAVIPARYSKAWVFSEGVAAVVENDSLFFIGYEGKRVFERGFVLPKGEGDFCFHNGYCVLRNEEGKMGLIDRKGEWVLAPTCDDLVREGREYWSVCKEERWGVLSDSLVEILPCEYEMVTISEDNGIYVSLADHTQKRYDYDGSVLNDFICGNVYQLSYDTGEYDDEGNSVMATAQCWMYMVETGYCGLMSTDGKPITPPLYRGIEALRKGIYRCSFDYDGSVSTILDNLGRVINL